MKDFIVKLQNNLLFKKICYLGLIGFLFLYTFSIPAFSARPTWNIVSYFMMAALGGFTVIYTFLYTKYKFNKWLLIPCFFALFAFVGTAIYSHEFRAWFTLILMLITLFVFYYAFVAIENKRLIFKTISLAFFAFAVYFAYVYRDSIIHFSLTNSRLGGYFDNVNAIGFYFAVAFTISLYISLFFKRKLELLFLIPAIIFFAFGFLTGSRAFLLAAAAGALLVIYYKLRKHKIIYFLSLVSLIAVFFVLINIPTFAFLKDQFERTLYTLFGIGNSKVDTSTVQRFLWPQYGFYLGGRNLLFGYGANGFAIYSGVGTYAHNNYAEVICNFGIIGFILYHLCLITPIILSIKMNREEELFLVVILVAIYLVRNLFGVTYYSKEAYIIMSLCFFLTKDCKLPIFLHKNKEITDDFNNQEVSI